MRGGEGGGERENGEGGENGNGDGGSVTRVKTGESGGLGGGLGCGRRLGGGGGAGGGRSVKSGTVLRKSATPHGFSQRSLVVNVVGLAGQYIWFATIEAAVLNQNVNCETLC